MSRQESLLSRYTSLREQFRKNLARALKTVAAGRNPEFFVSPRFWEFGDRTTERMGRHIEELLRSGDEIVKLGESLGESFPWEVRALHEACEESADHSNHQRLGPARLAQRLLVKLGHGAA